MSNVRFAFLIVATFVLGFSGFWLVQGGAMQLLARWFTPVVDCDAVDPVCRNRLRALAYLHMQAGRRDRALEAFGRAAFAGDPHAQFELGFAHEQAYRDGTGRPLTASRPVEEAATYGVAGLPTGEAFKRLVDRHSGPTTDKDKRLFDARSLAWLWYAAAAKSGFAPAMNNLGALYQFGLVGDIDRTTARRWYLAAWDKGNPVAGFNLERLRNVCSSDDTYLPLRRKPAPEDLMEPIFSQTRFRGREIDRGFKDLLRDMVQMADPGGEAERPEAKLPDSRIGAMIGIPGYGELIHVYDDETKEEAQHIPEWGEQREGPPIPRCDGRPAASRTDEPSPLELRRSALSKGAPLPRR